MRTNPRVEAAARVLAERWCTDYSQLEAAMRTTRADALALDRAGLLARVDDTPHFSAPHSGGYSGTSERGDRHPPTAPSATSRGATP